MKKLFSLLALFLGLSSLASAQMLPPDELVRTVSDEVLSIVRADKELQTANPKRVQQLVEVKVLPHFNFPHMTAFAMGRDWKLATPEQQKILTEEFKNLLVRTYSNAFSGFKNQTVTVKPLKLDPAETDATVRTQVNQPGGQPVQIDYSVEKTPTGWKAYDVTVAGSSLVTVYRTKFHSLVQDSGVEGLIKQLRESNQANAKK